MILKDKRILTIDDADTIRSYLKNVFVLNGAQVDGSATGEDGLLKCAKQHYDLILLDLFLPDMDGIEVLKNIRTTNTTSTVVLLTGHGGIRSAIVAVQHGADGYIEKQDITTPDHDHSEFMYALDQAMEHRAGILAQKQLDEVRADFYTMVTHDLRNPAGMIMMAADMLLNEARDPLTPEQLKFVTVMDEAAQRLFHLINNYLDFAKIDAGYLRLDLGRADLCEIVEASTLFAQLQARAKGQTLQLDLPSIPIQAWVDAERLKQVIDNLVSNAIKYTPEGGQVTVRLYTEAGFVIITVSDTGVGIPASHLPALFTKYHRIPGTSTRNVLGTGLGLLIVKEIVEAHQGTVEISSEGVPDKGTTFTVKMPLHLDIWSPEASVKSPQPEVKTIVQEDFSVDAEIQAIFLEESKQHMLTLRGAIAQLPDAPHPQVLLEKARLASHALKGNAGTMHYIAVYDLAAELDKVLQAAAKGDVVLHEPDMEDLSHLLDNLNTALADLANGNAG